MHILIEQWRRDVEHWQREGATDPEARGISWGLRNCADELEKTWHDEWHAVPGGYATNDCAICRKEMEESNGTH